MCRNKWLHSAGMAIESLKVFLNHRYALTVIVITYVYIMQSILF